MKWSKLRDLQFPAEASDAMGHGDKDVCSLRAARDRDLIWLSVHDRAGQSCLHPLALNLAGAPAGENSIPLMQTEKHKWSDFWAKIWNMLYTPVPRYIQNNIRTQFKIFYFSNII